VAATRTCCSYLPLLGLSPVGDVASAVENALAAYSGTTVAPHEYFDQTAAIPTPAYWHLASLPRYLQPEDGERLIASRVEPQTLGGLQVLRHQRLSFSLS
jgi:hypothetical protein